MCVVCVCVCMCVYVCVCVYVYVCVCVCVCVCGVKWRKKKERKKKKEKEEKKERRQKRHLKLQALAIQMHKFLRIEFEKEGGGWFSTRVAPVVCCKKPQSVEKKTLGHFFAVIALLWYDELPRGASAQLDGGEKKE